MGDHDKGRAVAPGEAEEEVDDRLTAGGIEIAGRLIGQKQARAGGGRAGQRDALLFAARELGGVVVGAVREAHGGQFGRGAGEGVAHPGEFEGRCDVFERGHGGDEVEGLEDDTHAGAPEEGELILVHRGEVLA